MGNSGLGGSLGGRRQRTEEEKKKDRERRQEEKRRIEAGPQRIGKKKKKSKDLISKLPSIAPASKCRLRLLRQERVKDYLLMEEEFIKN